MGRPAAASPPPLTTLDPSATQWPALWRHIPDPPAVVHVLGDPNWLDRPTVAVVGTRRATNRGLALAEGLARALALRGWTVASGLALGIDGAAHRGALAGAGGTVAVMGTGPDRIYPRAHRHLHGRIVRAGCSVTELPPGMPPLRHNFPKRNRLIAALSRAVVVVEAPLNSGALHTARLALDYDREVFAVPGPVDRTESRGCHRLLRDGAHVLEDATDIDRVLGPPSGTGPGGESAAAGPDGAAAPPVPAPGSSARWILDRLDLEGLPRDQLRRSWRGDEASWIEGLTALELAGLIRRLPGGRIARRVWPCP